MSSGMPLTNRRSPAPACSSRVAPSAVGTTRADTRKAEVDSGVRSADRERRLRHSLPLQIAQADRRQPGGGLQPRRRVEARAAGGDQERGTKAEAGKDDEHTDPNEQLEENADEGAARTGGALTGRGYRLWHGSGSNDGDARHAQREGVCARVVEVVTGTVVVRELQLARALDGAADRLRRRAAAGPHQQRADRMVRRERFTVLHERALRAAEALAAIPARTTEGDRRGGGLPVGEADPGIDPALLRGGVLVREAIDLLRAGDAGRHQCGHREGKHRCGCEDRSCHVRHGGIPSSGLGAGLVNPQRKHRRRCHPTLVPDRDGRARSRPGPVQRRCWQQLHGRGRICYSENG